MNEIFTKFPSTPYLSFLEKECVRNDKCFSIEERNAFLSNCIIVEEKIDGANLGISFDKQGNPVFQNRGGTINSFSGQWKQLFNWFLAHEHFLFDTLVDRYILFGEWCYARHSIFYDSLPDFFIAFDIYDKQNNCFYSVEKRNCFLNGSGIYCVPLIGKGYYSFEQLSKLVFISNYGQEKAEGIYLRIDAGEKLKQRAKLVRPLFHQTIEDHWRRRALVQNCLKKDKR